MKTKEEATIQVIRKKEPEIVSQLSRTVKRVVDHKTLEEIIKLSEEEKGID